TILGVVNRFLKHHFATVMVRTRKSLLNSIFVAIGIVVVGVILEWLSLLIYPHTLVNIPVTTKYEFGFLTFIRIVYYKNGVVLMSPPQLDYFQLFCIIAITYFLAKFFGRH
ncbi:MAG: hypothetical protein QW514_05610, partial [Thermoprotei archaeon]